MSVPAPRCVLRITFSYPTLELPSAIRRNVERCYYGTAVRTKHTALCRGKSSTGDAFCTIILVAPRRQRSTLPEISIHPMGYIPVSIVNTKDIGLWHTPQNIPISLEFTVKTGDQSVQSWLGWETKKKERNERHAHMYIYHIK